MKRFTSPQYTQIPNDLFDKYLPELGHAELKILLAILRQTLGYHKKKKRLSITAIEKLTGLSRSSVQSGCNSLVETGLVARIKDRGVTQWIVNWSDKPLDVGVLEQDAPAIPVKGTATKSDAIPEKGTDCTGKRHTPIPEEGTPSIKESIKETKSNKKRDSRSNKRPRQSSPKDKIRKELAEHFSSKTGLTIPTPTSGKQRREAGTLWYAPIREICELAEWNPIKGKRIIDITIDRLNGITISDPNSIIKTARAIVAEAKIGKGELRPKELHEMTDAEFTKHLEMG